jgi:hypothetical protein
MKTAKRPNNRNNRIGFTASTSALFKGGFVCRLYNNKGNLTRVSGWVFVSAGAEDVSEYVSRQF